MSRQNFTQTVIRSLLVCLFCWQQQGSNGQGNYYAQPLNSLFMIFNFFFINIGVFIQLNGMNYSNNSTVTITDIGSDDRALLCITNNSTCCRYYSLRAGEWYFPDKSRVLVNGYGGDLYRDRGDRVVRLHCRYNAFMPVGEYCCEVPDRAGDNQTVCVVVTLNRTESGEKMMQFIATSETVIIAIYFLCCILL